MSRLQRLEKYTESQLWQQLDKQRVEKDVATLISNVEKVVSQAREISKAIIKYMPFYTLHDERHILNILAIMDALLPDDVLVKMTPLECALCILTAHTHDLGMALSKEEHRKLLNDSTPEGQGYQQFRDGFSDEVRQIQHLTNSLADAEKNEQSQINERIAALEGHILSNYIRVKHATAERIGSWLEKMKQDDPRLFVYGNYDYQKALTLIGISHGEASHWLRKTLCTEHDDDFYRPVATGESANLAFAGILLRLADIMDFDASRAPTILFKHIGIENEISLREWRKHLSVDGWNITFNDDEPRLVYGVSSDHPVIEKSIRDFAGWINDELGSAVVELNAQRRHLDNDKERFDLHLAREAELKISRSGYIYEDIEFRLDQSEVMQLLMGENLYGDPKLCIRELLQNALDALHMRDLRLQMQAKGETPGEPVDPLKPAEKLHIEVSWGKEEGTGQDYLLVRDNGIGMTGHVIKNYFTQIGKSFYRSADFNREKKLLDNQDLLTTTISMFGIGILSSFMIADRLEVRTRPGQADDGDRKAYDVSISGPGSLFWLKNGTLEHQGTEIKLFLKTPYTIKHDAKRWLTRVQRDLGMKSSNSEDDNHHRIDPVRVVANVIMNPLYPVKLIRQKGKALTIDERFHIDVLDPLDTNAIKEKAAEWDCPESFVGNPNWGVWRWIDKETGSRVNFWYPYSGRKSRASRLPTDPDSSALLRQDELSSFVETSLAKENRTVIAVNSMLVEDTRVCNKYLTVITGKGSKLWLDLRGSAAPQLSVDRKTVLSKNKDTKWPEAFKAFLDRLQQNLCQASEAINQERNVRLALYMRDTHTNNTKKKTQLDVSLLESFKPSWQIKVGSNTTLWHKAQFIQERTLYRYLALDRDRYLARYLDRDRYRYRYLALDREHYLALDFALDFALDLARDLARDLALDLALEHYRTKIDSYNYGLNLNILQQSLWPDLSNSHPLLELFPYEGKIGSATLKSPSTFRLKFAEDGKYVIPSDLEGHEPPGLVDRGYDLCCPITSIPLGYLRRQCPAWRDERVYHAVATLFLWFPSLINKQSFSSWVNAHLNVERLHILLPELRLWEKPFSKWTEKDWQTCSLSVQWDFKANKVYWAHGAHHADDMPNIGLETEAFMQTIEDQD